MSTVSASDKKKKRTKSRRTNTEAKINIIQMHRFSGLQVPQIVVTDEHEDCDRIPTIKISIEGVSSSESDGNDDNDNERKTRVRLRPNYYRCCERVISRLTSLLS